MFSSQCNASSQRNNLIKLTHSDKTKKFQLNRLKLYVRDVIYVMVVQVIDLCSRAHRLSNYGGCYSWKHVCEFIFEFGQVVREMILYAKFAT